MRVVDYNADVIASTAQTTAVLILVAAAVVYLAVVLLRSLRGRAGCGSCHMNSEEGGAAGATRSEAHAGSKPQQIVPLENLAELARRHRENRT